MTPSLGRIVLTRVIPEMNNGATEAPAVVTRVWGPHPAGGWNVNLWVLPDSDNILWRTSVRLLDERPDEPNDVTAWWPPRA